MIKVNELYLGAKVNYLSGHVEVVNIGRTVIGVENKFGSYFNVDVSVLEPIKLTDHYFEELILSNGDELDDYFKIEERTHSIGGFVIYDVLNGAVVTTVNYVHEFEKLVELLLGVSVVDRDYYYFD